MPKNAHATLKNLFVSHVVELLAENWKPGYTRINGEMQNFFSVFSVYFPAAIGIFAGANVSGDLKVIRYRGS